MLGIRKLFAVDVGGTRTNGEIKMAQKSLRKVVSGYSNPFVLL